MEYTIVGPSETDELSTHTVNNDPAMELVTAFGNLPGNAKLYELDKKPAHIITQKQINDCADLVDAGVRNLFLNGDNPQEVAVFFVPNKAEADFVQSCVTFVEKQAGLDPLDVTIQRSPTGSYSLEFDRSTLHDTTKLSMALDKLIMNFRMLAREEVEKDMPALPGLQHVYDTHMALFACHALDEMLTKKHTIPSNAAFLKASSKEMHYDLFSYVQHTTPEDGIYHYQRKDFTPALQAHREALRYAEKFGARHYLNRMIAHSLIDHIPHKCTRLRSVIMPLEDICNYVQGGIKQRPYKEGETDREPTFAIGNIHGELTREHLHAIRLLLNDHYPDIDLAFDKHSQTVGLTILQQLLLNERCTDLFKNLRSFKYDEIEAELKSREDNLRAIDKAKATAKLAVGAHSARAIATSDNATIEADSVNKRLTEQKRNQFQEDFASIDAVTSLLDRLTPSTQHRSEYVANGIRLSVQSAKEGEELAGLFKKLVKGRVVRDSKTMGNGITKHYIDIDTTTAGKLGDIAKYYKTSRAEAMQSWNAGNTEEADLLRSMLLDEFAKRELPETVIAALPRAGGKALA